MLNRCFGGFPQKTESLDMLMNANYVIVENMLTLWYFENINSIY
jgi:hypothetical protein